MNGLHVKRPGSSINVINKNKESTEVGEFSRITLPHTRQRLTHQAVQRADGDP
jgi:hypothetical protein